LAAASPGSDAMRGHYLRNSRQGQLRVDESLRSASKVPFWLDSVDRPAVRAPLEGRHTTDLLVIGGGFSGLWSAIQAKRRQPDRTVTLLEGGRIAWAASGRNGGFCNYSLTHGLENGRKHAPTELEALERLGRDNFQELLADIRDFGIDCHLEEVPTLRALTEPYQLESVAGDPGFVNARQAQDLVRSPTYLGGIVRHGDTALLDPARLAWGLARHSEHLGVKVHETSRVLRLHSRPNGVLAETTSGQVHADKVILATNVFRPLIRGLRYFTVPVYDYVLVTEPLSGDQLEAVGWQGRHGLHDGGNQFHYYRLTPDNRILYGGYDAVYYGRQLRSRYDQREQTFSLLADHFFHTFPQLRGMRFTHRWGGAIDTCTRFFACYGRTMNGRVSYVLGHTGLGVCASRFSADVLLDLLGDERTERTQLAVIRHRPLPFPPEPLAYFGIQATRWSLAHADVHDGKKNAWLKALDRIGVGFDS
jgi:glycine/D-amino acid oxidase-like deaminating enzyme